MEKMCISLLKTYKIGAVVNLRYTEAEKSAPETVTCVLFRLGNKNEIILHQQINSI